MFLVSQDHNVLFFHSDRIVPQVPPYACIRSRAQALFSQNLMIQHAITRYLSNLDAAKLQK